MKNFILRISFLPVLLIWFVLFLPIFLISLLVWFVVGSKSFDLMTNYFVAPFTDYAFKVFDS
jgi:hypothetical protein